MNIGYMDRRITVQEDTGTANLYGEVSSTWSDVATVWAAMDMTNSSSRIEFEQETAKYMVTWRIRSSTISRAFTESMRVNDGSNIYHIKAILEKGRNDELHLVTQKVVSQ